MAPVPQGALARCQCGTAFIRTRPDEVCEDCVADAAARRAFLRARGPVLRQCACGATFRPATSEKRCPECRLRLLAVPVRRCACGAALKPKQLHCPTCSVLRRRASWDASARRRKSGEKAPRRKCLDCPVSIPKGANSRVVRCAVHAAEAKRERKRLKSIRAYAMRLLARMNSTSEEHL